MNKPGIPRVKDKGLKLESLLPLTPQGEGTVMKLLLLEPTEQLGEKTGQIRWGLVGHSDYWDFI